MLDGIFEIFADEDDGTLAATVSDIYISAFKEQDVEDALVFLRNKLPLWASAQSV